MEEWRVYKKTDFVDVNEKKYFIKKDFKLLQNFPNPFNPTTVISYYIPHNSYVEIKVYDLLGKMVKRLLNELQTSGKHTVEFNGNKFSSGIYFYTITAGDFSEAKKMLLLK